MALRRWSDKLQIPPRLPRPPTTPTPAAPPELAAPTSGGGQSLSNVFAQPVSTSVLSLSIFNDKEILCGEADFAGFQICSKQCFNTEGTGKKKDCRGTTLPGLRHKENKEGRREERERLEMNDEKVRNGINQESDRGSDNGHWKRHPHRSRAEHTF